MLSVDNKIASRSISARLLKVLHSLAARDQSCCVSGRFIGEMLLLFVILLTIVLRLVSLLR